MMHNEILKWWEGKRGIYNVILICFTILIIVWDYRYYNEIEISTNYDVEEKIWNAVFLIIGGNIAYCMGAGFDAAFNYYSGEELSNSTKYFLYVLGIFYSIFYVTFFLSPFID